jgi:hypothetical protein
VGHARADCGSRRCACACRCSCARGSELDHRSTTTASVDASDGVRAARRACSRRDLAGRARVRTRGSTSGDIHTVRCTSTRPPSRRIHAHRAAAHWRAGRRSRRDGLSRRDERRPLGPREVAAHRRGSRRSREEHPTPSIDGADQRGAFEPPTPDPSRPPIVPSFRVRPPALASRPTASRAHPAHKDRSGDLIIEEHRETGRTSLASDPRSTASPEHARSSSIPVASPSSTVLAVDPTHDLPRPPRRRESASEGIVRVEIGRVELRAAPSHETIRSERGVPKPESFVSLKDYLRGRGGT